MRPSPSCMTLSSANICQRCPYGEERRNMTLARATLGPFPDEWILSGLDKILYFCGIKNVCDLVEKFPLDTDFFLTSSDSDLDSIAPRSFDVMGGGHGTKDGLSESAIVVDEADNIVKVEKVSAISLDEEKDNRHLRKSLDNIQRSVSLIQQSLDQGHETGHKKSSQSRKLGGETQTSKSNRFSNESILKNKKRSILKHSLGSGAPVGAEARNPGSHSDPNLSSVSQGDTKGKLVTIYSSSTIPSHSEGAPPPLSKGSGVRASSIQKSLPGSKLQNNGLPEGESGEPNKIARFSDPCRPKKLPKIIGTRWAMARINLFNDCSRTYEILEIKGRLPRAVIPCKTVVFFAVLPDGSTICYDYVKSKKL
ncbi:uncharacterized protein LOC119661420 isoform X1 [Hermetia illucens]|uniref:uncharacterized protein LOC119661420 isoform X1 n=1 Tax=Hermetia illucens TaxID=343691 RepID=UPI0018CC346F|nr:uncharacterized protein LOC119661420 isoform X1 [Hermetia illucens]